MRKLTLLAMKAACVALFFLSSSLFLRAQCTGPNAIEIPGNGFDEDCDGLDGLFLQLPPFVYGVEGQDMEIYFWNLILSKHPQDYVFDVSTPLGGQVFGKKWSLVPSAAQIGETPLTINVKSPSGATLATAQTIVRISPAGLPQNPSPKKLWLFGHSFFDQGYMPKYLRDRLDQPDNPPISMHGKKQSWAPPFPKHEGYGGMMWRWFLNDGGSPFRYGNGIDLDRYFDDVCGASQRPDWMVVHLDINDFCGYTALAGTTLQEIDDSIENDWSLHADKILMKIRQAAPAAKLAICISPPPNERESAFATTYGGNPVLNDRWRWQKIVSRIIFKNIQRYAGREAENIYLIPEFLDIDCFAEYNPPDARHPDPADGLLTTHCGYQEIAKTIFAWLKFQEHLGGPLPLVDQWRDSDGDGFGDAAQKTASAQLLQGFVKNSSDCDDTRAWVYPGAPENCQNGIDDDCDGAIDEDFSPPVLVCKTTPVEFFLNADGQADLSPLALVESATDGCSGVVLSIDQAQFTCFDAGKTLVLNITATDGAGNSSACQALVSVRDAEPPALVCRSIIEAELDSSGFAQIQIADALLSATDNCGALSFGLSKSQFSCFDIGQSTIFLQAQDASGNVSNCPIELNVDDLLPPELVCRQSIEIKVDTIGSTTTVQPTEIVLFATDNCGGPVQFSLSQTSFSKADIGAVPLQLTATDGSSNSSTCSVIANVSLDQTLSSGAEPSRATLWRAGPSPADVFFVLAPSERQPNGSVRVFDALGRAVFEKRGAELLPDGLVVPTAAWPDGLYFIEVRLPNITERPFSKPFLVAH